MMLDSMLQPDISMVVPVYNEASRITSGLQAIVAYARGLPLSSEIVIVDDGSTDETAELARTLLPEGMGRVLEEPHRGKGGAVRAGMLAAAGRAAVFLDIDLATPLHFIEPCVKMIGDGADVVIGSRRTGDARIEQHQGAVREFLGRGYSMLSRVFTGVDVRDFTCGFKGFRREAAQAIFSRQRIDNWSFDSEILFLTRHLGLRLRELPVTWRDDHRTKVRLGRDIATSFGGLLRIRLGQLRGHYGQARPGA